MVISRRFIRSIWEAAAILLAVIIAPLRELFHSLNFNHHPTLTSSSSSSPSSRSSLQHHPVLIILDNSHCIQLCLLVFIFAFCFVLRLSHVSAKFARWIERYLWHWWHDTNGQRWRKEIFCPQLKLCEPQWRRIRRTKLTKVQNTNYKMCLSIPFQAKHKIKRKFPHSKLFYQSQSLEHTLRLFCKLMH